MDAVGDVRVVAWDVVLAYFACVDLVPSVRGRRLGGDPYRGAFLHLGAFAGEESGHLEVACVDLAGVAAYVRLVVPVLAVPGGLVRAGDDADLPFVRG